MIQYIFLETFSKRKVTVMVGLRLLEKLSRLDTTWAFKKRVYEELRKPLARLIGAVRNIDLHIGNVNAVSRWIEDIFTKNYDLKKVILSNLPQIYDFGLQLDQQICHDLLLFDNNDSEDKRIYNSIFLLSRIVYFFERNMKPARKMYNFWNMYYNFYSGSIYSKLKENKSYNIDDQRSVPARIRVKSQGRVSTIEVEVFVDDFYVVIVYKENAFEWAKILFLAKQKDIRMKLSEDACISIHTIVDRKICYILFESDAYARKVYTLLKKKKKSIIMRELTLFSENVEALKRLLHRNKSTESFDIPTMIRNGVSQDLVGSGDQEAVGSQMTAGVEDDASR